MATLQSKSLLSRYTPAKALFNGIVGLIFLFYSCQKSQSSQDVPTTPPPAKPTVAAVITSAVSSIDFDSATSGGTITLNGDTSAIIESGVCYDTLPNPDILKGGIINTVASGSFSCVLAPLISGTGYHVRAFIKQAKGFTYGQDIAFIAYKYPPLVGQTFFNGKITALCADSKGNIYAGGGFSTTAPIGGNFNFSSAPVAQWNGKTWTLCTGLQSLDLTTLAAGPNGTIFAGSENLNYLEWDVLSYNGNAWSNVGVYDNYAYSITAICADAFGNVYTIGDYQNGSGKYYVAKWGPSGYATLGAFSVLPLTICTDAAGNLYVGGLMENGYNGGPGNFYIAKWDGTSWSEMGLFNDVVTSICFDLAGNMLVAGAFTLDPAGNVQSGGPSLNAGGDYYVAKWNGTSWSALGNLNINKYYGNDITNIYTDPSGNVYAIGNNTDANGNYYVNRWNGSTWQELASFNNRINALCIDIYGNVYAAGEFQLAPGQYYVAKCN